MANVSFAFLDVDFNIQQASNADYSSEEFAASTQYSYLSTGGVDIDFEGTGFTFGAPFPTGGAVENIYYDPGNDDTFGGSQIEITGLSIPLVAFDVGTGTQAEQSARFWRTALQGDDIISLTPGDFALVFRFAGDGGDLLADSGVAVGGDDQFLSAGGALTHDQSRAYGDFVDVFDGAIAVGGDDFFNISAYLIAADFASVEVGGVGIGGDDVIAPLVLSDNANSFTWLAGDADVVYGALAGGDDLIDLRETDVSTFTEQLSLIGDSIDVFTGAVLIGGDDTIYGSSIGEQIYGEGVSLGGSQTGGSDLLFGFGGNDTISGDTGDDTIAGGDGADSIDGGNGRDTVDYSEKTGGVSVNLLGGSATTGGALNAGGFYVGGAIEDSISAVENIVGSEFGDRLVGASGSSVIEGAGGNDNISSFSGNDRLDGGAGNDTLDGGGSNDTLVGGLGLDTLNGGTGFDTVDYSAAAGGVNINLINGTGIAGGAMSGNTYVGGALEDSLSGIENAVGSAFGDRLIGVSAGSTIDGGGGNDRITGFSGVDVFRGGDGNDTLEGGGNHDMLRGGAGQDTLDGGTGLDAADYSDRSGGVSVNLTNGAAITGGAVNGAGAYIGGALEDTLIAIENVTGSNFGDRLISGGGSSVIDGGRGNDKIISFGGNDSLTGGFGDDDIEAGGGSDTLTGGAGDDQLFGGTGDDRFVFANGGRNDTIEDFTLGSTVDEIQISGFGFGFDSFSEVIAAATEIGPHVVFDFGNGQSLTVLNATIAQFTSGDFVFG